MTARTRLARWTVPVLLTTGALALAGCGEQPSAGAGASVAEDSPTAKPSPTRTSEPEQPSEEPEPSETPDEADGPPAEALLPADELPGFNEEFTWQEQATEDREPPELAGTCDQFELSSIGAEQVAYRTYRPVQGPGPAASELVAQFPDEMTATRAEQVLLSWRKDCATKLKKYDMVDVHDLTDVPVDEGTAGWYMVTYGPAEDDPESVYFDAQGVVRVGNRIAVLRMPLIGQDYNYDEGEEPMVLAASAAAARL